MDATFYTNSFNRLPLLSNLLRSFELCNQSANVEWVITDYGSTDGSREWLRDYASSASFPVWLIFGDEQQYFHQLKVPVVDRRARLEAILRKYRNDARAAARGRYIFDIGSDHQFIRPADFVAEVDAVFCHRAEQVGHLDLSGVIAFGYFRWRLDKPNNARASEANSDDVPYFIARQKAYVDYSVMHRDVIDQIGPYFELIDLEPDTPRMEQWLSRDDAVRPETDYILRCARLGLRRAYLKFPLLVTFRNDELDDLVAHNRDDGALLVPLWTLADMRSRFGWLSRPVSSEELRGVLSPTLAEKGLAYLRTWKP